MRLGSVALGSGLVVLGFKGSSVIRVDVRVGSVRFRVGSARV